MKKLAKFKKTITICISIMLILSSFAIFTSCKKQDSQKIKVYVTSKNCVETMDFEKYIEGVVAGEMDNSAPIEALKAQAVLARTFAKKFISEKKSKYSSADISTDISEAQAYNPSKVNENIALAVKETKGQVITFEGELINAYFHSNSGGKTASAVEGLNTSEEYSYIISTSSPETESNSRNYNFSCTLTYSQILSALRNMGVSVTSVNSFKKGEVGKSGRCLSFIIAGKEVNANTFRLNIGSTKLRSTLISSITTGEDGVTLVGKSYGHGVGLSQEGAVVLAKEGKNYKEILNHYFKDILVK